MGAEHTFYDYVDESGENTIHVWLHSIPQEARGKLTKRLLHLEALNKGQWQRPLVDTLTDRECDGLFEVRASISRQEYRILGCHGIAHTDPNRLPKNPTLLHAFVKKGGPVPQKECREAHRIREIIEANPKKYGVEHVYD